MKRLIHIIVFILAAAPAATLHAVTDKEMEQARVIATQAYLRYANDGSGYLDELRPKTMAELERSLKQKEKENIKAFKAISVPSDYKSWDKARLVDFWSKAFSTKGLAEKGRVGRKRAANRISAMTISAPAKAEAPKAEAPKAADSNAKNAKDAKKDVVPAVRQSEVEPKQDPSPTPDSLAQAANAAELQAMQALEEEEQIEKAENHTWIYIVILIILVGVVVALVVFASNVMKRSGGRPAVINADTAAASDIPASKAAAMEANTLREKFAARLAEKNSEVAALNKKIEQLNASNASLKGKIEALTAEIAALRARPAAPASPAAVKTSSAETRTIYLGRANSKGIFVRADRTLNPGNSVFRLDTTDGYAGSFRVADDPTVWDMALATPRESLAGACVAPELDNTSGKRSIVNDSSGTAVFEGGCWRVLRKAKIHYE